MNAWNYGVPQKRERLITIGIRNDLLSKWFYMFPAQHSYKPTMKDVKLDFQPAKEDCEYYSEYKENIFKLVPPGGY